MLCTVPAARPSNHCFVLRAFACPEKDLMRERHRASLWTVVRMQYRSSPRLVTVALAYVATRGLLPVALAVSTGSLVGAVPGAVREGLSSPSGRTLLVWLGATTGLYLFMHVIYVPFVSTLCHVAGFRFGGYVRDRLMESLLAPSELGPLDDPAVADHVAVAGRVARESHVPISITESLLELGSTRLSGLASAVLLVRWHWWAAVLLVAVWSPLPRWIRRVSESEIARMETNTASLRRADYHLGLAWGQAPAKEVRVFGLGRWLVGRFRTSWASGMDELASLRSRRYEVVPVLVVASAATALVIGMLVRDVALGRVDLALLVIGIGAALGVRGVGETSTWWWYSLQGASWLRRAEELPEVIGAASRAPAGTHSADGLPSQRIAFDGVSFAYPGRSPVLHGLDLDVGARTSLAIVGPNGAGKTTLVKLLCGLYAPQGGRILVDERDMRELDIDSWRSRLAVIFQDFIHYDLPARDNVAFDATAVELDRAAQIGGADDVIAGLPNGWDTVLGAGYRRGTELSGGQWQRIALARAFAAVGRGAEVLVLDEPTANLDVRAEAELFERFLDLTSGLTTILVSHRFSTVRRCERICVLDEGRVVELGSHGELMDRDGLYARMFRLQAARFRERT